MTVGYYQNELRDLRGNAMTAAVVDVFDAGTTTPAILFSDEAGTPLVSSPLAASAGLLLPGKDVAANIAFFAAIGDYDVRVTDSSGAFTFRAHVGLGSVSDVGGGVSGIGALERTGAVVSGSFDALADWRTALGSVRAGTANARMLAIGDSTTGGWPTSYIDRCANLWAANRLDSSRHGAIFTTNPPLYVEGRVVYGAGWSNGGVGDFGPANRGVAMGAIGAAGTLDVGPVTCDRFEIFYFDAGGGTFDWWIDAGAHTTVTFGATNVPLSVITPSVTAGTHTLHIGNIVGNLAFIPFVEPRLGTSGLYVARFGLGSTTSTMWASEASLFASSLLVFHALQPALTVIMLIANDFNSQADLGTFHDNIDGMVELGLTYGSVVLGVSPRSTITAYDEFNSYNEYIAVLEGIRDARDVAMVNFANHFANDNPSLYMADTLHPTVDAQGEMALVLASALMP